MQLWSFDGSITSLFERGCKLVQQVFHFKENLKCNSSLQLRGVSIGVCKFKNECLGGLRIPGTFAPILIFSVNTFCLKTEYFLL